MEKTYQMCTRCVMDTTAAGISFNDNGICNYCTEFLSRSGHILNENLGEKKRRLDAFISKIKNDGRGKKYDCIVGVSGGVDSSWVLVKAVELGLRPLAVHMDNGWNSELAQNNIANLVNGLHVDLYTHVIDWHEYKTLMQAMFDADVIDIELLYDNAMLAVNYRQAKKYGIKYILSGSNTTSEGMAMPRNWNWLKYDKKNIQAIAKRFQNMKLSTFPAIGTFGFLVSTFIKRIQWTSILDLLDYNKYDAMKELEGKHGYKPYPYKHYESIFTRFYQGYILPRKFNVDKRKLHLSTLIISGQLSRDEALMDLNKIPYHSEKELEEDKAYFLKKMGWSPEELESYLARPERKHNEYPSESKLWYGLLSVYKKYYLKK